MNTYACFIFLLAVGLSAQISEFEIDFQNMVNTVKLEDNKTLLSCTEKCDEAKDECRCRKFSCSVETSVIDCIKNGLGHLKLSKTENIITRLTSEVGLENKDNRILRDQKLSTKMSPKSFLDYILALYQKENAEKSG